MDQAIKSEINSLRREIAELRTLLQPIGTQIRSKWLTKAEAKELLRCSMRTLETRMAEGVFRYSKNGGRVLLLGADVRDYLEDGMVDNKGARGYKRGK